MKMSLALKPRRALGRSEAWQCLTANLALPGSGSLLAGRPVGYAQAALALVGMGISLVSGGYFMFWYYQSAGDAANVDALDNLSKLWSAARWPLAGLAVFFVATAWAVLTSILILSTSSGSTPPPLPPQGPPPLPR